MTGESERVEEIIFSFYEKVVVDPIIAYHFRKTLQKDFNYDPLAPPIELFSGHLERITAFWKWQLGLSERADKISLIPTHRQLRLKKGELDRWLTLFRHTLDEKCPSLELRKKIDEKLIFFEERFRSDPFMFT